MSGEWTNLVLPLAARHLLRAAYRLPYLPMRALLPLIVLALLLAGCGYKAPLYLPKPKPEAQKAAPPAAQPDDKKSAPE